MKLTLWPGVVVVQANGAASSFAGASTPFTYPCLVSRDGAVDLAANVEDAGDGIGSDWVCWFDPELQL